MVTDSKRPLSCVKTVCQRDCPDTCFLDAYITEGKIIFTKGSKESPITQGFLCPRGVGDPKRVYSTGRILYPHVKDGKCFRKVTWKEALDLVSARLRNVLEVSGRSSILFYDYAGNQGSLSLQYPQRFWRTIGATMTDGALCCASGHAGIGLHYGLSYGLGFEDVLKFGTVVFWGNNAKISSPHLWAFALRARQEKGTRLISIDPRKSETSESSDFWINPYPGSDVALFYGIAWYLIKHDHVVHDFLKKQTNGYDKLVEEVEKWSPERVEEETRLEWRRIEALCKLLVEESHAAFMIGLGLNKSSHGAEACRAVSLLPALLGQDRGFHFSDSKGRFIDWGYLNGTTASKKTSRVVEQVSVGPRLMAGAFKFVFVSCSNPALTLPNQKDVRAGLSRKDTFVVVHDTHWTETTELADVVLPGATYLEKFDLCPSDHHVYLRLSPRTIEPLGESKDEIWVMQQIAQRIGCLEPELFEDPLLALKKSTTSAFENGSFDELLKGAILKLRQRPANEYQTPSGKIELYSSGAIGIGANPLPVQLPLSYDENWFTLLNTALPSWTHSQFRDVYGPIPQIVWISVFDAKQLGVESGQNVSLFNDNGKATVEAVVTDKISKGVLWCPRPLTGKNGVPLNILSSSDPQTIGATSRFNSTKVKIQKVQ